VSLEALPRRCGDRRKFFVFLDVKPAFRDPAVAEFQQQLFERCRFGNPISRMLESFTS
jgi:hypothetical protein